MIEPLGDIKIRQLTPSKIVAWIKLLRKTLGERTAGLIYSHLNSILVMAVDDEVVRKNPCDSRSVQRVKPRRQIGGSRILPSTGTTPKA
ncbi:hypothetical protein [Streptomyces sp. NPDC008139]|uniref:hypothetical protein n=1 Tax=Streptomyces sp. NPDC008139 TaxID=3364814 RepID=UPI0036E7B8C4